MDICGKSESELDNLAIDCYTMMSKLYKKEYSEMLNIFYGISVTQILSKDETSVLSHCCEPYSVISLSIPNKNNTTLFECFDLYYNKEEMFGENAWYNDKTEQKEDVYKRVIFWSLPNIMIIDLKRFNNSNTKKNYHIDIPINNVDFSKYIAGYNKDQYIYDLYGIINHSGGVFGGHYVATIKNANGEWYMFNDRMISKINEDKIITRQAYCLFYRKRIFN
jgi:ubiquitin C-terminal hydrolase